MAVQQQSGAIPAIPPSCAYRIKRDIKEILKNPLPGVFIEQDEQDILTVHTIVVGPDGTPYEKGYFYFIFTFPSNYPFSPPEVKFMTTGSGLCRLNPNLYACGKVCLSIIGTWGHGPGWSPQLTLKSVILSIQSLLNEYPYHNEPGYETEKKVGDAAQYNEIILHETIRVAVVGMVRGDSHLVVPISLQLFIQQQFVLNLNYYERVVQQKMGLTGNVMMDPLYGYDSMSVFQYDKLLQSILDLKKEMKISSD